MTKTNDYVRGLLFAMRLIRERKMTVETAPTLVEVAEKIKAEIDSAVAQAKEEIDNAKV